MKRSSIIKIALLSLFALSLFACKNSFNSEVDSDYGYLRIGVDTELTETARIIKLMI